MSEQFTIETTTTKQLLQVLDYVYKSEPVKLKPIASYIYYGDIFRDRQIYSILMDAGVADTYYYDAAQSQAEEDGNDWWDMDSYDKYQYLDDIGISEWGYFDEIMETAIGEYLTQFAPSVIEDDCDCIIEATRETINGNNEFKEYLAEKCKEYQSKS